MIKISDGSINSYQENTSKADFLKLDNLKFRVKHSPFSRRQINAMSEKGLLIENRKNNEKWRSFTFKELVYLVILKEIKKFSLESNQLIDLKNCFFKKKGDDFDVVFPLMLMKIQIYIIIGNDFKIYFTDLAMFSDTVSQFDSYLCLDFNEIVNKFLEELKVERFEPTIKTHLQFNKQVAMRFKKN